MTTPRNSTIARDRRLAVRQGLQPRTASGSLAGFGNLLNKELGEWFRTRRSAVAKRNLATLDQWVHRFHSLSPPNHRPGGNARGG